MAGKKPRSHKSKHNYIVNKTVAEFQKKYPQGRLWRREPVTAREIHSGALVTMGQSGMSDLYGYVHAFGIAVYLEIEIKTGKSTLKSHQKTWGETTLKNGGIFIVGREDIEKTLEEIETSVLALENRWKKDE